MRRPCAYVANNLPKKTVIPASCICTCLKFTILWFQDQQRDYTEKKTTGTGVLLHYGIVHELTVRAR